MHGLVSAVSHFVCQLARSVMIPAWIDAGEKRIHIRVRVCIYIYRYIYRYIDIYIYIYNVHTIRVHNIYIYI